MKIWSALYRIEQGIGCEILVYDQVRESARVEVESDRRRADRQRFNGFKSDVLRVPVIEGFCAAEFCR